MNQSETPQHKELKRLALILAQAHGDRIAAVTWTPRQAGLNAASDGGR
jgi:hypothetical protein